MEKFDGYMECVEHICKVSGGLVLQIIDLGYGSLLVSVYVSAYECVFASFTSSSIP